MEKMNELKDIASHLKVMADFMESVSLHMIRVGGDAMINHSQELKNASDLARGWVDEILFENLKQQF